MFWLCGLVYTDYTMFKLGGGFEGGVTVALFFVKMKMACGINLSLTLLLCVLVTRVEGDVNTTSGIVRGAKIPGTKVTEYLGIPYAESPEGDLRFKPPVKKAWMDGIYEANSSGRICPQAYPMPSSVPTVETEDCLRLDIYQPDSASRDNLVPVMIWIHGGGYITGHSSLFYGGVIAGQSEVIVVTLNYRLGILGFLHTMNSDSVGNFGLRDQCLAIEWVSENIGAFGGNASQVTIFGVSAGASSVLQLTMSTLCSDKFNRVIAQSGAATSNWAYNKNPIKAAHKLANVSGCPSDSQSLVSCLRNKTIQEISDLQKLVSTYDDDMCLPFFSTDIFPDNPLTIMGGLDSPGLRRFRSKDLLTGVCNEEGEYGNRDVIFLADNMTVFEQALNDSMKVSFGIDDYELDRLFPSILFKYTDWKKRNDEFASAKMIIAFKSDVDFNLNAIQTAKLHSDSTQNSTAPKNTGNSFFYQFIAKPSWVPSDPWTIGSTHTDDIGFVFNFVQFFRGTAQETELANQIVRYWTNFAKSGSPNKPTPVNITWPEYNRLTGEYIKLDFQIKSDEFPYARRIAFWEDLVKPILTRVRQERKDMDERCHKDYVINFGKSSPQSIIYTCSFLFIFVLICV